MFWKSLLGLRPKAVKSIAAQAGRDELAPGPHPPLVVYIHIPKTAGSTVNFLLKVWDKRGKDHCESIIGNSEIFTRTVSRAPWISGHFTIAQIREALANTIERPVRLFGLVRDPTDQVTSHYNWLIEIFSRGNDFYAGHSDEVKHISEKIRNTDNLDPVAIIDRLAEFSGLFLNQQSRCLLDTDEKNPLRIDFTQLLGGFEMIATEAAIPKLILCATGRSAEYIARKNESPYHFDRSVFANPKMIAFLSEMNSIDQRLYDFVSK